MKILLSLLVWAVLWEIVGRTGPGGALITVRS